MQQTETAQMDGVVLESYLGPDTDLGLFLHVSLGGAAPRRVQVDTGSTGIVVPRSSIGACRPATDLKLLPFINYNSSGKTFYGEWVYTSLVISGVNGATATVDEIAVLAVDDVKCPKGCDTPEDKQRILAHLGMMGVGFDRGATMGTPDQNPFLNLREMRAGHMRRGYAIGASYVSLGLPVDLDGFTFLPLEPAANGDWSQARGSVTLSGDGISAPMGPVRGITLVDTGVSEMILAYAPNLRPTFYGEQVSTLPPGTRVTVRWETAPNPFEYSFVVAANPTPTGPAPTAVRWAEADPVPIFVNTSRHLLWTADYLYDAAGGRIGFRPLAEFRR